MTKGFVSFHVFVRIALALAFVSFVSPASAQDPQQHSTHDDSLNYYALFDQLEWHTGDHHTGVNWDVKGWVGKDKDRFWYRTEGLREDGTISNAHAHLLYGRMVGRWWDFVAGVRQDSRPGDPQTWASIGVQGLAPYWIEVEATAYVGAGGRNHYRLELEHELRITNRLFLQPQLETEIYGKADPEHEFGAGLATLDTGLRLRYEFKREFAPYLGAVWYRKVGGTAELSEAAGHNIGGWRVAAGLRTWF
jgi:copper resistance protein B